MRIAVIGAGCGLAQRAVAAGLEVRAFAPDAAAAERLDAAGITRLGAWTDFFDAMEPPRVYLLDLPLGAELDRILDQGSAVMEPGDVVVDPGGSWWCDTLRRWRRLRHRALWYVDAAETAAPDGTLWLLAGDAPGVELAKPCIVRLAAPAPVLRVGSVGAAHFLRAVQDGVEAALAQACSEAVQLAEAWPGELDFEPVRRLWSTPPVPGGREAWLPDDAVRLEASIPLVAQAVMLRVAERLEEHRSEPPPPRCGPFVTPEELDQG